MLPELAIGDAYGACFEYANENIKYNTLERYVKHPRHNVYLGQYTDDTQLSIAIAEMLISGKEWTPLNITNSFVECFKRDWRDGYARGFQKFLESINSGQDFLDRIKPNSDKSGAAMRAGPIGIINAPHKVISMSKIQAKLTHDTPDGIEAAVASALLTHYFIYENDRARNVGIWVNKVLDECNFASNHDWGEDYIGKVKSKGWMSTQAAITAVRRNNKLSDLLVDCINFTGDTDTVATIALCAASCSAEYKKDLPQVLFDTLENGKYGKDYLIELDKKLFTAFR